MASRRPPRPPTAFATSLAFIVAFMMGGVRGLCPGTCECDDLALEVSCVKAGLDVMPNTLNPGLTKIVYKYNDFPTVDVSMR